MLNGSENNWVDSIVGLQRNIDEHERFLGDVMLLAISRDLNRQFIGGHQGSKFFEPVWNAVASLMKENAELTARLAQFSQESGENKEKSIKED